MRGGTTLVLISALAVGVFIAEVFVAGPEDDERVTLEEVPAAVRRTIEAHVRGGTITELERTTDHGRVLYEVDVRTADGEIEFDVEADGTFAGYEEDDEGEDDGENVKRAFGALPAPVRATFAKMAHGAAPTDVEAFQGLKLPGYEIEFGEEGSETAVVMTEEGAVIAVETETSAEALPAAARAALAEVYGGATIGEVVSLQVFSYEVEIKLENGETIELAVTPEGTIRESSDDDADDDGDMPDDDDDGDDDSEDDDD